MSSIVLCLDHDLDVHIPHSEKYVLHYDTFANGEYRIHLPHVAFENTCVYIYKKFFSQTLHQDLSMLFFTIMTVRAYTPARIVLLLPYLPYSRKDREDLTNDYRDGVTFKYLLHQRACAGVQEIVTLDLHNPVTKYFSDIKIVNLHLIDELNYLFTTGNIWIAPDYGSVKSTLSLAHRFLGEYMIVDKIRTGKNRVQFGGLFSHHTIDLTNKDIYLYDDMVDTGGTLVGILDYLVHHGSYKTIKVIFTHPLLSDNAVDLLNRYHHYNVVYYTTDSYGDSYQKLMNTTIIPVAHIYQKYLVS